MEKPSLVIIHGLLGALDSLRHLESLIKAAETRTIHLLGYGDHRDAPTAGITLAAQAAHAARQIDTLSGKKAWILGHSVGGAVSMVLAHQRPDLVESVINVEGNFTLRDAFWSARIAAMTPEQWREEFEALKSDPLVWLRNNDITQTPQALAWATSMLQREQPASTVHNIARAVIAATSPPEYLQMIRRVMDRTPVHLVAGEKSAAGWDVPDWARSKAASYTAIPETGHMMMLEDPPGFASEISRILVSS